MYKVWYIYSEYVVGNVLVYKFFFCGGIWLIVVNRKYVEIVGISFVFVCNSKNVGSSVC